MRIFLCWLQIKEMIYYCFRDLLSYREILAKTSPEARLT